MKQSLSVSLKIALVFKWVAFIAFVFYGISFIEHSIRHAAYPWSSDYVEMPELGRAIALSNGEAIYKEWNEAPFHEANYTPLYTCLNAVFVSIGGHSLLWGRLISFICVGLTTFFMARILIALKIPVFYAIFSGLLYCSGHIIWMWGSLVRVDNLAVLFQIAALWVYLDGYINKKNKRALLWCAIFLVAAAFTRQTMVAAALAVIASLFHVNKKQAIRFTALYALIGLLGLGLLLVLSSGLAWQHLVSANVNEFGMNELFFFIERSWGLYHWMIPLCLVGLIALKHSRLLIVYFIAALCVSTTVGKIGASLNYLIELWAASCMLTAAGLWKLNRPKEQKWAVGLPILSWIIVFIGWQQIFHFPYKRTLTEENKLIKKPLNHYQWAAEINQWLPFHYLDPFGKSPAEIEKGVYREFLYSKDEQSHAIMSSVEAELIEIEDSILSEDMNFTLSLGKDIWIQPFEFTQLARQGLWNANKWKRAVENKEFGALVLMFDLSIDVPSPVDAAILSAPEKVGFRFKQNSPLFQIQSGDQKGPVIIPIEGTLLKINVEPGQMVAKGESLALIAPKIGKLTSQRFPSDVLTAMRTHYALHKRIGDYRIYFPIQH